MGSSHLPPIVQSLVGLGAWLIILAIVFMPLERVFAIRRRPGRRASILTDVGYFFLSGLVPGAVLSVPVAALAWASHHILPGLAGTVAEMPSALRIAAGMVVMEVGLYWGHRWSHEIPLLWRFHAIHHSPTHLDWLVNSRAHPVDFVFTRFCGLVPLYVLGLANPVGGTAVATPLVVLLPGVAWGFFIHANLRWRFGILEWLVATPAFHQWHHANDGPESIDRNYAPLLPWIDVLFGTLHLPRDRHPSRYGTDTPVAASLPGQLIRPFIPSGEPVVVDPSGEGTVPTA